MVERRDYFDGKSDCLIKHDHEAPRTVADTTRRNGKQQQYGRLVKRAGDFLLSRGEYKRKKFSNVFIIDCITCFVHVA